MMRRVLMLPMLLASVPALAQEEEEEQKEIILYHPPVEYIVVSGSGALTPAPGDQVLMTEFLRERDFGVGTRVENLLRDQAGLAQFRRSDGRSAHTTSQGVTLRGLGGNASSRAVVTLDGVPQADPFGGWVAWSAFDAVALKGVRITRGGGGGPDGPGALAGSIALLTGLDNGGQVSAAYGSRASVDIAASGATLLGNGDIGVDARFSRGDGFAPIVAERRGAVDRAAPYRQGGGGIRLRAYDQGNSRVEASVRGFFDRRDRGVDFTRSRVDGVDASIRFLHDPTPYDGWLVSALAYVQLRDFDTGFASVDATRSSVAPALEQHVPATGLGARVEVRPSIGRDNPLRIGMDWRRTVGRTEEDFFFTGTVPGRHRTAGGRSDTLGGFAEFTHGNVWEELLLSGSVRVDRWWLGEGYRLERNIGGTIRSDDRFPARSGWEWSGRVGARIELDTGIHVRSALYRGWRLPTLNELYRPFRVGADATAANEALDPEHLWGVEAGIDARIDATELSATVFHNRLNGAIANVTLGQGPGNFPGVGFVAAGGSYSQRQNLDAIRARGVELSLSAPLLDWFYLRASYAFTDARVRASGPAAALNGRRPAQVARHSGSVTASYDSSTIDAKLSLRYVGAQNEDDLGLLRLGDALTADAQVAVEVTEGMTVELRGENLFDALVPAAISSGGIVERATPRTLWAGLRWSF